MTAHGPALRAAQRLRELNALGREIPNLDYIPEPPEDFMAWADQPPRERKQADFTEVDAYIREWKAKRRRGIE